MKEILTEIDLYSIYKKLKENLENENFTITEHNSARIFYVKNYEPNIIYKLAKNNLGLEMNKKEIELSKTEEYFGNSTIIDNRTLLIKTEIKNCKQDLISTIIGQCSPLEKQLFLNCLLEYEYFKNLNRFSTRKMNLDDLINRLHALNKRYNIAYLNKSNIHIQQLINIVIKHKLEPGDLVKGAHIDSNNKLNLFIFGLTENIYFKNMRKIFLQAPRITIGCSLIRRFNGDFDIDSQTKTFLKSSNYKSLQDFYKLTFNEDINFLDNSIYNKNNMFIKVANNESEE